nr:helix-turn-helix domain-containing protein [Lachnospiraceae bacterium]
MLSGDLLKRLRLSRGITQQEIADAIGKSKKWVGEIENFRVVPTQEVHDAWIKAVYDLPDRSSEYRGLASRQRPKR